MVGGVHGGYDGWVSSLGSILGFIIERGRSHGDHLGGSSRHSCHVSSLGATIRGTRWRWGHRLLLWARPLGWWSV